MAIKTENRKPIDERSKEAHALLHPGSVTADLVKRFEAQSKPTDTFCTLAWRMVRLLGEALALEDCSIFKLDEAHAQLKQVAAYGSKNPEGKQITNPMRIDLGSGICGFVALTGQSQVIQNTIDSSLYIVDDKPRFSEVCVPIVWKRGRQTNILGVIDCESSEFSFYTSEHESCIQALAKVLAKRVFMYHQLGSLSSAANQPLK